LYSGEGVICGEEIFFLKGDASGGGIAPYSDHWTVRRDGLVYGPRYHRIMSPSKYAGRFSPSRGSGPYDAWERTEVRFVALPHWIVAAATAALPLAFFTVAYRRRRRHGPGRCSRCGYDLRATPDRCPECGKGDLKVATATGAAGSRE
jgi:hypothetical protein